MEIVDDFPRLSYGCVEIEIDAEVDDHSKIYEGEAYHKDDLDTITSIYSVDGTRLGIKFIFERHHETGRFKIRMKQPYIWILNIRLYSFCTGIQQNCSKQQPYSNLKQDGWEEYGFVN